MKALRYYLKSSWRLNLLLVSAYGVVILLSNQFLQFLFHFRQSFNVASPWQNTLVLVLTGFSNVSSSLGLFVIFAYVIYNAYSIYLSLFTDNEVAIATGALTRSRAVVSKIATAVMCYVPIGFITSALYIYYSSQFHVGLGPQANRVLAYTVLLNVIGSVMTILTYMLVVTGVLAWLKRRTSNRETAIGVLVAVVYLTSIYVGRVLQTLTLIRPISLDASTPALARASSITGLIVYAVPCVVFGLLTAYHLPD